MAIKKPLTPEERLYNQIRGKLKGFITRGESKGFQFFTNVLPKVPKNIKPESISKLQKLWENRENLYKKAIYGGSASGGFSVSGVKGAKLEAEAKRERKRERDRQRRQKRKQPEYYPDTTFTVPDNVNVDTAFFDIATIGEFKRLIARFPKKAYPILNRWVDNLIEEHGQHNVANMLNKGLASGLTINHKIAYDDTAIYEFMADMLDYLDADTSMQGELMDALESDEDYNPFI